MCTTHLQMRNCLSLKTINDRKIHNHFCICVYACSNGLIDTFLFTGLVQGLAANWAFGNAHQQMDHAQRISPAAVLSRSLLLLQHLQRSAEGCSGLQPGSDPGLGISSGGSAGRRLAARLHL